MPPSTCISWRFSAVDRDIQHDGRKHGRDRSRRQQHVDNEIAGLRIVGCGNRTDIPDDGTALVEVRRQNEQQPALAVFLGKLLDHARVDMMLDQSAQWCAVDEGIGGDGSDQGRTLLKDIARVRFGINRGKLLVVSAAQEGERRRKSPGADTGHHVELRAVAARAPSDQKSRSECTIVATAGKCKEIAGVWWPRAVATLIGFYCDIVDPVGVAHVEARVRSIQNVDLPRLCIGDSRKAFECRATGNGDGRKQAGEHTNAGA